MTVTNPALAEAITAIILDAWPWWKKITKAQRFRAEVIGHRAAAAAEAVARQEHP